MALSESYSFVIFTHQSIYYTDKEKSRHLLYRDSCPIRFKYVFFVKDREHEEGPFFKRVLLNRYP